jgi:hypothetical protein
VLFLGEPHFLFCTDEERSLPKTLALEIKKLADGAERIVNSYTRNSAESYQSSRCSYWRMPEHVMRLTSSIL